MTALAPAAPPAAAPAPIPTVANRIGPGQVPHANAKKSGPVVEFGKGFRDEIQAQGLGFVDTAKAIWKFVSNPNAEVIRSKLADLRQVVAYVVAHPKEAAKAMGESVAARVLRGVRNNNNSYAAGALIAIVGALTLGGAASATALRAVKKFIDKAGKSKEVNEAQKATNTATAAAITAEVVSKATVPFKDFPNNTVDHSFKHAAQWGVRHRINERTGKPHSPNTAEKAAFLRVLKAHIASDEVVAIKGTFWKKEAVHFVHPTTGHNIVQNADGNFTAGYQLKPAELERLLKDGDL